MKNPELCRNVLGSICVCIGGWACTAFANAGCPPVPYTEATLIALKESQWKAEDRNQRQQSAIALLACLSSPNPLLRDQIAFEALSFWMRSNQLDPSTIREISTRLMAQLQSQPTLENAEFAAPFAALVLAEVARVDRLRAFMTEEERDQTVRLAASYLRSVKDYRGYHDTEGWRHGVAHAADWMMQLSLNPALTTEQQLFMLQSMATQIKNEQHFYQYGEPERLATPVLYLALRLELNQSTWQAWFDSLFETDLPPRVTSQASLARRHNLNAFFSALFLKLQLGVQENKREIMQERLGKPLLSSIKRLN